MARKCTPCAGGQVPRFSRHNYQWRSFTALVSMTPTVTLKNTHLAFRARPSRVCWAFLAALYKSNCDRGFRSLALARLSGYTRVHLVVPDARHHFPSGFDAKVGFKPLISSVIPVPPLPQAKQCLLVMTDELLPFALHGIGSSALVDLMDNPRNLLAFLVFFVSSSIFGTCSSSLSLSLHLSSHVPERSIFPFALT